MNIKFNFLILVLSQKCIVMIKLLRHVEFISNFKIASFKILSVFFTFTFYPTYLKAQNAPIEVLAYIEKDYFYDLSNVIDISFLENKPPGTGVLYAYYGPQSIDCHKKLDREASMEMREVRRKKDNLDYTLIVDWEECKIISLSPYSNKARNDKSTYTLYQITLTSKLKSETKSKVAGIKTKDNSVSTSSYKHTLLVTQVDTQGEWLATGPYGTSQPYNSEQEAIKELYYDEPGALTFICKRDNFKIYAINNKTDNVRIDVREFLKRFGITDIPN